MTKWKMGLALNPSFKVGFLVVKQREFCRPLALFRPPSLHTSWIPTPTCQSEDDLRKSIDLRLLWFYSHFKGGSLATDGVSKTSMNLVQCQATVRWRTGPNYWCLKFLEGKGLEWVVSLWLSKVYTQQEHIWTCLESPLPLKHGVIAYFFKRVTETPGALSLSPTGA